MNPPTGKESVLAVPDSGSSRTLIDALLAEQRELTAVEQFARAHERHEIAEPRYRTLLPTAAPGPGQQYAFEVDLDQCSGCKACVTACHSLNGLDDDETWRSVGRLASTDWRAPLQQFVTTACHHCVDPGCLNGCPVLAYDKDPATGIVRHLDDQCIGCQYCVMKCPYEVPQYSKARGIVRKCDMCSSRLATGEAPACVQACPNEAIQITVVEQAKVRGRYRELPEFAGMGKGREGLKGQWDTVLATNPFLPDSPNPAITLPTTRYVSQRALPADLKAADADEVHPSKAHPPLTFMLVLTQCGVGLALMDALAGGGSRILGIAALLVTVLGMVVGTLHLGQPLKAWRSFLGWRKSWLSRELIAFAAFIGALGVHLLLGHPLSGLFTTLAGLLAVACSAMVYVDTRRPFWNAPTTFGKFFGTTLLLGSAGTLFLSYLGDTPALTQSLVLALVVFGAAFKLAVEQRVFRAGSAGILPASSSNQSNRRQDASAPSKTAHLLSDTFGLLSRVRVLCVIMGGVVLPVVMLVSAPKSTLAALALGLCLVGELIERHLFFVAEVAPKMPGGHGV